MQGGTHRSKSRFLASIENKFKINRTMLSFFLPSWSLLSLVYHGPVLAYSHTCITHLAPKESEFVTHN